MYSVLIVDDEIEIREGLSKKFPWDGFGISKVYTAKDGEDALIKAEEVNPSIVITDIKMNRMSGLEFIQLLNKSKHFTGKSIVISGYDDFELAKEAIKLGVLNYILKPINKIELSAVVKEALDQIKKAKMDNDNKMLLKNQAQLSLYKMQEEIVKDVTINHYRHNWKMRISHRLKSLHLNWLADDKLAILMIEVDDLKAIEQARGSYRERELILFSIENVVRQTIEEEYSVPFSMFFDYKDRCLVVLSASRSELDDFKNLAMICISRINQYVKVNVSVSLSSVYGDVTQLNAMYEEANDIIELKVAYGGNRLLMENELGVDAELLEVSIHDFDEVLDLIKYGSDEEILRVMDDFTEMVKSWSLQHIKEIHQSIFKWLLELFKKASSAGWRNDDWAKNPIAIWEQLEQYDTINSLRMQVETFILQMANDLRALPDTQNLIISEAEQYILEHYHDNLTLHSVAEEVHVTPVWLSKLFKREKQQTFLEHLTEIRMMKAKEMLDNVNYKIYQVSANVGYKDPVHFSKVFKKNVGLTPTEYRNHRGILHD